MMHGDRLRPAFDQRGFFLAPFVANRAVRGLWRALVWGFWLVYFGFVVLVLALRYAVLPHVETYRGDIERLSSRALGQAVSIGRVEASWEGINPDLTLLDVRVADAEGRPGRAHFVPFAPFRTNNLVAKGAGISADVQFELPGAAVGGHAPPNLGFGAL